jgi:hypothetical protein
MNTIIKILTGLFLAFFIASCNKNEVIQKDNLIVVEGYLYQSEQVDSIHLTNTVSFESDDTIYPPVTDASVTIANNSTQYELENIGNGYYQYNGTDLQINVGENYSIKIISGNQEVTSSTVVPSTPDNVTISDTILSVDTTFTFGPPQRNSTQDTAQQSGITITWSNPDNDYFFIVIQSIDPNASDIVYNTGNMPGGNNTPPTGSGINRGFNFRSEPFKSDTYTVNSRSLTKYGMHRVKIYRVNQEYADLYENRQQDSRNLTEPITNIKNGLGIFTAFSYAEVTFRVVIKD